METEKRPSFAEIVTQFLEQWCDHDTDQLTAERPLCTRFGTFWRQVTAQALSSEVLEAFREELLQRGYFLMTGKPAYWKGLRLRGQWKKPPKTDLSVRKREVLLLFAQRDVWSIVELARADKCSVPTVSRAVDRLERQGLVWCVTAPEDRRRVLVRLTARGKELINTFG